jgi:hypothetical protein
MVHLAGSLWEERLQVFKDNALKALNLETWTLKTGVMTGTRRAEAGKRLQNLAFGSQALFWDIP